MKFTIALDELQSILKYLRTSVKTNTTDPAGRIVIHATDSRVEFLASDSLNFLLAFSEDATIEEAGETSVLYNSISTFINSFQPYTEESGGVKNIIFRLNDKSLGINLEYVSSSGVTSRSKARLPVFSAMYDKEVFDFGNTNFTLTSSMLKAALDKVLFTIDPLHNINFLRGANINFSDDYIYIAGTNGIIISEYAVKNVSSFSNGSYILSSSFVKGLRNIIANLSNEELPVNFSIPNEGVVKIKVGNVIFVGMLIKGYEYPNYRAEFLKDFKYSLKIDKNLFLNNLNPIMGLLEDEDNFRVTFTCSGNLITLSNTVGESSFTIDCAVEPDISIDLNGRYLKEIINSIKDELILMQFTNESSTVVFDSEMFTDQKALISPIKRRSV